MDVQMRKRLIAAALGQAKFDLVLKNVRIVNVYSGKIETGNIGIIDRYIASLEADPAMAEHIEDGQGSFAIPGFLDAHVHLDSTLLSPESLAEVIVPQGTTCMLADPMESANVGGLAGLQALIQSRDELPYHLLIEVSSRVPTAPGMETTGGEIGLKDIEALLSSDVSASLGELDPSKVLGMLDDYLARVEAAYARGKISNGHAAGLEGKELNAYACGGLSDDHECIDEKDAMARIRLGMAVLVREGSSERNLELILRGVLSGEINPRHLVFCTDDKHPDDILREGHINYMVRRSIEMGVAPMQAIQMATINTAMHFHIEHMLGSITPGRFADILLVDDIKEIKPRLVYAKGKLAARYGKLVSLPPAGRYPEWFKNTVKVSRGKNAEDFRLIAPGKTARVHVIEISGDQIINRTGSAELEAGPAGVLSDPFQDVIKLAVVERYGKNGNIGISFVRGFGLRNGAIASSVAHDHHNIIIAGTNDEDMAACVREVEALQGGLAIASGGKVLGSIALPLGGLMSDLPAQDVIDQLQQLNALYRQLGGKFAAPFMSLSFISLPTVPEFGLTDKGLIDVRRHCVISTFVD